MVLFKKKMITTFLTRDIAFLFTLVVCNCFFKIELDFYNEAII